MKKVLLIVLAMLSLVACENQTCIGGYPADKMPKPVVAKTTSKENGFYQLQLEPGKYSVFTLEEGRMYADGEDGYGGINPIIIVAGSLLQFNIILNHGVD